MKIDPGDFRFRAELQQPDVSTDECGNEVQNWNTALTLWTAASSLFGQEYWAAAAQGQEDTVVFTTRWSPALASLAAEKELTRCRILFEGKPYKIQSYDDIGFCRRLVKLRGVCL